MLRHQDHQAPVSTPEGHPEEKRQGRLYLPEGTQCPGAHLRHPGPRRRQTIEGCDLLCKWLLLQSREGNSRAEATQIPQSPLVNHSHPSTNGAHGSEARLTRLQELRSGPGSTAFCGGGRMTGREGQSVFQEWSECALHPRRRDSLRPSSPSPPPRLRSCPCHVHRLCGHRSALRSTGSPAPQGGVGTAPKEFRRPWFSPHLGVFNIYYETLCHQLNSMMHTGRMSSTTCLSSSPATRRPSAHHILPDASK